MRRNFGLAPPDPLPPPPVIRVAPPARPDCLLSSVTVKDDALSCAMIPARRYYSNFNGSLFDGDTSSRVVSNKV